MTPAPYEKDRSTILIHHYRAMVGRADTWRMRMDATTNWAIVATAAVISFALGNSAVPHYGVFISSLLTLSFLALEARRLTFYHLWQRRVLILERGLIRPALWSGCADGPPGTALGEADFREALDPHLGSTIPIMPLWKAAARRLRRVYVYLLGVQLIAWIFKLVSDPTPATSFAEVSARAQVAGLPGPVVFVIVGACFVAAAVAAIVFGRRDWRPQL